MFDPRMLEAMRRADGLADGAAEGADGTAPMTQKQARQMAEQLILLRDDLRYIFAHLEMENLSEDLQKTIRDGGANAALLRRVGDVEGNMSQIRQTAKQISIRVTDAEGALAELVLDTSGLVAAIDNNRLSFTASGLTIKNAAGETVFQQDNATGDLMITGAIVADTGRIGGFTIESGALSNGDAIRLDAANGLIRLGGLTITDKAIGPVLEAATGLAIRVAGSLYMAMGNGMIQMNYPLKAQYGLYINPSDTTAQPANVYCEPGSGRLYRSTASGGGTGGGPLTASVSLSGYSVAPGTQVTVSCAASGGTSPYGYQLAVSVDGGAFAAIPGGGAAAVYTPAQNGVYRFRAIVTDAGGQAVEAYSGDLSVGSAGGILTAYVDANQASVPVGLSVTWTIHASGGSGQYGYRMILIGEGNVWLQLYLTATATRTMHEAGSCYMEFQVDDLVTGESYSGVGGFVNVGTQSYGYTTGTHVNVRSGPGTGYPILTNIPDSGTQVTITGSLYMGWWPVYYGGINGYIREDYLVV